MSEKLALEGGPRTVPEGLIKTWPVITEADRKAVLAVLDSGHLHGTGAPQAVALQKEWAQYCGVKYALVTNSGTSAIHMGLAAVGVEAHDEVITCALTYWSTAAAILHQCAIPVFVDIEPVTYNIDPTKIEEKITERTKAILPVDLHGMPCDMDPILDLARRYDLKVVTDSCQAHGAEYKGRKVGSLGDVSAFSLNRSKNLCGCDGGLLTTDNEEYYERAKMVREFGEVIIHGREREYMAYGLGWNYRSVEFVNAFTRSQLTRLEEYNEKRRELAHRLTAAFKDIPGVEGPPEPEGRKPVYFAYVVTFRPDQLGLDEVEPARFTAAAERALNAEGIGMGKWQRVPVPGMVVFQKKRAFGKGEPWRSARSNVVYRAEDYPETLKFLASHSYLRGVHPPNDVELIDLYLEGFKKVMGQMDKVLALVERQEQA